MSSHFHNQPIQNIEKSDGISHTNELRKVLVRTMRIFTNTMTNASFRITGRKYEIPRNNFQ